MKKHPLQTALENLECQPDLRSYSGRGMYGKNCLAFTMDRDRDTMSIVFQFGYAAREHAEDDGGSATNQIEHAIMSMRSDSMGQGAVYYFPGVPYVEQEGPGESYRNEEEEDNADSE